MKKLFILLIVLTLTACSSNKIQQPEKAPIKLSDDSIIMYAIGDIAKQEGDIVGAMTLLYRSYEESPNNRVILENLSETYILLTEEEKTEFPKVLTWLDNYLENVDFNIRIAEKYAVLLYQENKFERAEAMFTKVADLYPSETSVIKLLMFLHSQKKLTPPDFERIFALETNASSWEIIDPILQKEFLILLEYLINNYPDNAEYVSENSYKTFKSAKIFWLWFKYYYSKKDFVAATNLLETHFAQDITLEEKYLPLLLRVYLLQGETDKVTQYQRKYPNKQDKDIQEIYLSAAIKNNELNLVISALENLIPLDTEEQSIFEYKYFASLLLLNNYHYKTWVSLAEKHNLYNQLSAYLYANYKSKQLNLEQMVAKSDSLIAEGMPSFRKNLIIASLLSELEEHDNSLPFLEQLTPEPLNNEQLVYVSFLWFRTGKLQNADIYINKLDKKEYPKNFLKADLYRSIDDDSTAVDFYWKSVQSDSLSLQDYFFIGTFFEKQAEYDKLLITAKMSYEHSPEEASALNYYGYSLLIFTDQMELAEELITKAFDKNPDDDGIRDSIGWLYYKKGKYRLAKEFFDKLIENEVNNSEVAYHLGALFLKLDDSDSAMKYLVKATELNNHSRSVKEANKLIKKMIKISEEK
jgi:Flp pilus assembly protein TadD